MQADGSEAEHYKVLLCVQLQGVFAEFKLRDLENDIVMDVFSKDTQNEQTMKGT